MSRQFKVGDIVNASSNGFELTEKPVGEVAGNYIRVCTFLFTPDELTLVTPVESRRGAEQYKDQFAPWLVAALVINGEPAYGMLEEAETEAKSVANSAIRRMMKEQQT